MNENKLQPNIRVFVTRNANLGTPDKADVYVVRCYADPAQADADERNYEQDVRVCRDKGYPHDGPRSLAYGDASYAFAVRPDGRPELLAYRPSKNGPYVFCRKDGRYYSRSDAQYYVLECGAPYALYRDPDGKLWTDLPELGGKPAGSPDQAVLTYENTVREYYGEDA